MIKIPERIRKYPLVSLAVVVLLALVALYALADIFGAEWLAGQIESRLDAPTTTEGAEP